MLRSWKTRLIFLFLSGFILLFVISPLAGLYLKTSPGQYSEVMADGEVWKSVRLTLFTSFAACIIFGIASIPLSYILARKNFPGKGIINGIIDLPIVIPHSAAGIALLGIISRNTYAGKAAEAFGFSFVGSEAGIIVAMAFVSIPFVINAARDGFAAVPERLEKAALNLGASSWRVFFTISLPLAKKSVLTGLTTMWARGLSEFGAVVIVAYNPMVTPVLIWERFASFGLSYARPVAAVFVVVCLLIFIGLRFLSKNNFHVRN